MVNVSLSDVCLSAVTAAGRSEEEMCGLSELQWGEPAAAALNAEPAHHAAGEHVTHRTAGGEPESAPEPGTHTHQGSHGCGKPGNI